MIPFRHVLAVSVLLGTVAPIWAETNALPAWSALEFEAHKLMLTAKSRLSVEMLEEGQAEEMLREMPGARSGVEPRGQTAVVSVASDLPFGRNELTTTLLNYCDGGALQSEKLVSGRKHYYKLYRYGPNGYFQWRKKPANDKESDQSHRSWSSSTRAFFDFRPAVEAKTVVCDSYSLLYLIAVSGFEKADTARTFVINDKADLIALEVRSWEVLEGSAQWVDTGPGGQRTTEVTRLRRVTITPKALVAGVDADRIETGILGMRGDLTMLVNEEDGTPVRISGSAKGLGTITVKLAKRILRR